MNMVNKQDEIARFSAQNIWLLHISDATDFTMYRICTKCNHYPPVCPIPCPTAEKCIKQVLWKILEFSARLN